MWDSFWHEISLSRFYFDSLEFALTIIIIKWCEFMNTVFKYLEMTKWQFKMRKFSIKYKYTIWVNHIQTNSGQHKWLPTTSNDKWSGLTHWVCYLNDKYFSFDFNVGLLGFNFPINMWQHTLYVWECLWISCITSASV